MKIRVIALGLLFSLMFTSCVYHPQSVDIPLIYEKNIARFDAMQLAYSLTLPCFIGVII